MEVIDTNVLLIANGQHDNISPECELACVERLEAVEVMGSVAIDTNRLILSEYENNTRPNKGKGTGDVFLKWLLRNQHNPARCALVELTRTGPDSFAEFPDPGLEARFDPSDRKFIAVANAHPEKPPILQASDCKWLNWRGALVSHGITIDFICPDDVKRFYVAKFPGQPIPDP